MHGHTLNESSRLENARALAAALGLTDVTHAAELLRVRILVTHESNDADASLIASELVSLLSRTVSLVGIETTPPEFNTEIVIGSARSRTEAPKLFISGDFGGASISRTRLSSARLKIGHPILGLLTACYAAGAALRVATKDAFPFTRQDPLIVDFTQFGIDLRSLNNPLSLGVAYLAGAGAVGNGFLWALRYLDVHGELHIVDYDKVEDGNLNRQIWFDDSDITYSKAKRLSENAQAAFPTLKLTPRDMRLQQLPEKNNGAWLTRLIVAVDSRRARRSIQGEIPGEVFDASTTDIREIVVHYHKQPTQHACLSCIYAEDEQELSREAHIAEHLGLSCAQVRAQTIDAEAARIISSRFATKFPDPDQLIGIAYDTLFKALCSEGALQSQAGRQVIAPFAFVSVLAGTLLTLELVRRLHVGTHDANFNYWKLSPWHAPIAKLRRLIQPLGDCSFCGDKTLAGVTQSLWGNE